MQRSLKIFVYLILFLFFSSVAKAYDATDFSALVSSWLRNVSSSTADSNADGKIDSRDLGIMMSNWGTGTTEPQQTCGNGNCTDPENCTTCPHDCGACPVPVDNIIIRARGVAGGEIIDLKVNGEVVRSFTLATAYQNYSAYANVTSQDTITTNFTNDNGARNVQIDYAEINGTRYEAEYQSINTGAWNDATGACGGSYSDLMACNGYIVWSETAAPQETCGNGRCLGGETCSSCPGDCGVCPVGGSANVGAYYFEGWTTGSPHVVDTKLNPANDPQSLYQHRKPIWGWYDDTMAITEQQINLAADHGLSFFAFDWYWADDAGPINVSEIESKMENQGLKRYMQAGNKNRLKFALLVANHGGSRIVGTAAWRQAADYWMEKYFKDPQYLKTNGKPVLYIFDPGDGDAAGFDYMQQLARDNGLPGIAIVDAGPGSTYTGALQSYYTITSRYNTSIDGWGAGWVEKSYTALRPFLSYDSRISIPNVVAGWDARPWEGPWLNGWGGTPASWYYSLDRTPQNFANFLQQAITWMDNNPGQVTPEKIMTIYAWNENGEGGYFMPTVGDPNGEWLDALQSVVAP